MGRPRRGAFSLLLGRVKRPSQAPADAHQGPLLLLADHPSRAREWGDRGLRTHLSTLPLKVIIAPLHTVPTRQKMMAYGLPVTVPCHTASITPTVSVMSAASSCPLG